MFYIKTDMVKSTDMTNLEMTSVVLRKHLMQKTNTVFKENVNHLDIQDIVLMKLAEHILHKPESINLKEECLRQKM